MISRSLPPRLRAVFSYWLMLKVLAPIEAKSDEMVFSKAETTVRMPTRAVIPMAIMSTVRMVRSNCVFTEPIAIRTFSLNNCSIILICHEITIFVTSLFLGGIIYFKNKIFAGEIRSKRIELRSAIA